MSESGADPAQIVSDLRFVLSAAADPAQAEPMAAYMKHHYVFFGVKAADRRTVTKPLLAAAARWTGAELLSVAECLFAEPEREFHYVACDLLRRWVDRLGGADLRRVRRLVETKSWWDTVDALATHVVGPIVRADRSLQSEMDAWVDDDNMWIVRTAVLHQLLWKADTDAGRLFDYCERRSGDPDFFIRKALGWALRQYARTDPAAVRGFVAANEDRLSPLTKREALRHVGP